ncbi:MFS transporter [Dokdonella sp.]|uniref:MFS transporter n=1 Tax=Dokdonella sp. TaxID=2291710 RepID=UPI001B2CDB9F|nr:MFS transporter [Dokdonella sp.]MBO9662096.1 MFS transporter [Dokdonella sp.]
MAVTTTSADARRNSIALVAVCLASLMFGLEISSVPVILPTLEKVLHADFKDLQWIMNAYTIACTTVLMATGTLADRFGRKRVFLLCIAAFALTSLWCGVAQNVGVLVVGRFLQGMAGGAMFICTVAVLSHQFREGAERSRAFVAWGVISGIGLGFGPLIGGVIVAASNWQWVFLIQVPLAVVALLLAVAHVRESRDPNAEKLDLAGILTLSVAVFALTYAITQGPDLGGFTAPATLAILAVSLAAFVAFVRVERRHAHPMFDFSVFKIRAFSGAIVGCVGMNFSYWPLMIYLPIYFQGVLGYDSTTSGLFLLAYTLPFLVMTPLAERLLQRRGARFAVPFGLAAIGAGFLLMLWGSSVEQANGWTILPGTLLAGVGIGLTNTPVTNTTTASVSSDRAGMASGIDVSARLIALAINIAVMGLLLQNGVAAQLVHALGGAIDGTQVRTMAESIAAGNLAASDAAARSALAQGFAWVLTYGGLGVLALAALSYFVFGATPRSAPATTAVARLAADGAECPNAASCNP